MSQEYQNLKLKKIMAIYGCELKQSIRSGFLDVVAEDGNIVLHGSMDQIREEMIMNAMAYGEPIIHPSAVSFYESSPIIKTARKAKVEEITVQMDDDLARHNKMLKDAEKILVEEVERLELSDGDTDSDCDKDPVIKAHVVVPPPGFSLPENKIGALQEKYQSLGVFPSYNISRKEEYVPYYECQLRLGYLEVKARGMNKRQAKHNAAGQMLFKITDEDPFVKPDDVCYDSGVESGDGIIYNENYVPDGLEEPEPKAPPRAFWAGMLSSAANPILPRLNRRARRAQQFAANCYGGAKNRYKEIPQSQVEKWANEPIPQEVWSRLEKIEKEICCCLDNWKCRACSEN